MTRKKVMVNETRKWKCPICEQFLPNEREEKYRFKNKYALARHLAMKGGNPSIPLTKIKRAHLEWRIKRGLPPYYRTLREVNNLTKQILKIIEVNEKE